MMFLVSNTSIVQSESQEQILNTNLKIIIILIISIVLISLLLFRNFLFKSTYLLKSFGELSVDPEIAFTNNKPTFLEFYAEWCEVCKEMAPQVSAFKDEYEKDINFVFLNVDNQNGVIISRNLPSTEFLKLIFLINRVIYYLLLLVNKMKQKLENQLII